MSVKTSGAVRATDAPRPALLAGARIPGRDDPIDVHVVDGVVASIAPAGTAAAQGSERIDLDGRFLVPGLYDRHVHFSQWAM